MSDEQTKALALQIGRNIDRLLKENRLSQKELAAAIGVEESSVGKWVLGRNMPLMGSVQKVADYFGVPKSSITETESGDVDTIRIPICGTIAAGAPIYACQDIEQYLVGPVLWGVNFGLRVKGTSMIGADIPDGSIVLCKSQEDVDDGEIAVCIIDGEEATLKRVRRYAGVLVLHPENPSMEDYVFTGKEKATVKIIGLAKKVIKDL